jgi:nicotinamidase-related amidase
VRRGLYRATLATAVAAVLAGLVASASANHNAFSHVSMGARKGSGDFDVLFKTASSDGTRVLFETQEQLTNDDTDGAWDVYERTGGATTLASKGSINGNGALEARFAGASRDGLKVFFTTAEKLTGDDGDGAVDVYQRAAGITTRISKGQINGNSAFDAFFGGSTPDGQKVFFGTLERLTSDDSDDAGDVYQRSGGTTTRVSKGAIGGDGNFHAGYDGTSSDGTRVFFETDEPLTSEDEDAAWDIYERHADATTLVSQTGLSEEPSFFFGASVDGSRVFFRNGYVLYEYFGGGTLILAGGSGSGDYPPNFVGASADGTHVFIETDESLTTDDGDSHVDVYDSSGGVLILVSVNPPYGSEFHDASYRGASMDGSRVFFDTDEQLTDDDTNGIRDVYMREGGALTRISVGPTVVATFGSYFAGASADGSHVFLTSDAQLTSDDTDAHYDIYERFGGTTRLISKGNGPFSADIRAVSTGGDRVVYATWEAVTADDTDSAYDLYQRFGSTTSRLSDGEVKGNGPFPSAAAGSSGDGGRLVFTTTEQLTNDDTDSSVDLYQRVGTTTTRLSAGAINGQGPHDVTFRGASGDGTKVFFTTTERLTSEDTDFLADIYQRGGGATTLVSRGEPPEFGEFEYDVVFAGASADGTKALFTTLEQLTTDDSDFQVDLFQWSAGSPLAVKVSAGNEPVDAAFRGVSSTGTKVFFTTAEKLVSEDTDSALDVYQWSAGVTTRISQGLAGGNGGSNATFAGSSADGGKVFFTTAEKLTYDDLDSAADLYQRSGTTTVRISQGPGTGNGAFPASFAGTAGTHVFFTTAEALTADDTDSQVDIYDRTGTTTTRVSQGAINGNGAFAPTFVGASSDGTKVFFTTVEKLADDDTDSVVDVYRRYSGTTTWMSQGQIHGNGPIPVTFRAISADGSRVFFTSDEVLTSNDTDAKTDVYERVGGTTYRASSGNGPFAATYRAASSDGKRMFFETAEKVVAADTDGSTDVYAAVAP